MAHLSESYSRKGVLSRNSTYRHDCRGYLGGLGIYDNAAVILQGITNRDMAMQSRYPSRAGGIYNGRTREQRVPTYFLNYFRESHGKLNFEIAALPYRNFSHHIVPLEVFHDEKWTAQHLKVVLMSKYNINNEENIIHLPQCHGELHLCDYHSLPDHSKCHNRYNERLKGECDAIYDMVEDALEEPNCKKKKDIREQIYKKLMSIQENNLKTLRSLGGKPME